MRSLLYYLSGRGQVRQEQAVLRALALVGGLLAGLGGCATTQRAAPQAVHEQPATQNVDPTVQFTPHADPADRHDGDPARKALRVEESADLAPFASVNGGELVYRRTGKREAAGGVDYLVRMGATQRAEGALAPTTAVPITHYLEAEDSDEPPPEFTWPVHKTKSHAEFFLTFDPPMVQLPRKLAEGQSQRLRSKLRCYNYKGKKSVGGDVTRTIKRMPNESATAGGQAYADCAHLELRTRYNINLVGWIEAREEVWLARDVGEVRRSQNWEGLILLRRVRETWDMELIEKRGQAESTSAQDDVNDSSNALEAWSACAAYVEPALPTPYLQGVVADLRPTSITMK